MSEHKAKSIDWWNHGSDAHTTVLSEVRSIAKLYDSVHARWLRNLSVYTMRKVGSLSPNAFYETGDSAYYHSERESGGRDIPVTYNATRNLVNTANAMIGASKPYPRMSTFDANRAQQREAKRMELFVRGVFRKERVHTKSQKAHLHACIMNQGWLHVRHSSHYEGEEGEEARIGDISIDIAYPWEVYADPTDAFYGKPRVWYREETLPRDVAMEMYGVDAKTKKVIEKASRLNLSDASDDCTSEHYIDAVTIVHAWRTSGGNNRKPGSYMVVASSGIVQKCVDYKYTNPPLVCVPYSQPLWGLEGDSLVDEAYPVQVELDKQVMRRSQYQRVVGRPIVRKRLGAKMQVPQGFEEMEIPVFQLQDPGDMTIDMNPSSNPSWDRDVEGTNQKLYELTGINMGFSQGQTDPSITAGVAQREVKKTANQRLSMQQYGYDWAVGVELAKRVLEVAEMAVEVFECTDVEVPAEKKRRRTNFASKIKFKELSVSLNDLEFSLSPASALPDDPAAKVQTLTEWLQANLITPQEYMMMTDIPDLEFARDLKVSPDDAILSDLDSIIEDGDYRPPEPFIDPQRGIQIATAIYMSSRNNDEEESKLDMLRNYIRACEKMVANAQASAAAQQAVAQGPGPGLAPTDSAIMPPVGPQV